MDTLSNPLPLPLPTNIATEVIENAKDFAFSHGLVAKSKNESVPYEYAVSFVSFALLPSPWPKGQFETVSELQKDMNEIYYRASNNFDFLKKSLERTCEADEWTRRLWQMHERTHKSQQNVPSLCILRSDYMIDEDGHAKQIEVNTIASGFGGLSPIVRQKHKYTLSKLRRSDLCEKIPENKAWYVASGLAEAWKAYGNADAAICFVLEDVVYNIYDQRQIEMALIDIFHIKAHLILRSKNKDLLKARLDKDDKLWLDNVEIAVLYLRTWYDPSQLNSEELWTKREEIERSKAIKCPNLAWHLSGCKKIQQELGRPGGVEQFCDSKEQVNRVRKAFAGLYALEEENSFQMIAKNPEKFVIKPQREGGGNNIYGKDITAFLKTLPVSQRNEYIAMDLIKPTVQKNYIVNANNTIFGDTVSELGIFGYVLADKERIIRCETDCGWILRVKEADSMEGGVAAGYGYLSSVLLI